MYYNLAFKTCVLISVPDVRSIGTGHSKNSAAPHLLDFSPSLVYGIGQWRVEVMGYRGWL